MVRTSLLWIAPVVALAFGSTACGKGSNASPVTHADEPRADIAGQVKSRANEIDVYEADNAFFHQGKQIVTLKMRVGDRVRFENKDLRPHILYSQSEGNAFDVGALLQYQSRSIAFEQRGEVEVRCKLHPDMLLMVDIR